ncbi:MAG: hypothetical protein GY713_22000 [Actinomycetia bacterium]|nr:hypothetical protein [Actinomycetes bacterium]
MIQDPRAPSLRFARLVAGTTLSVGMLLASTGVAAAQSDPASSESGSIGSPSVSLETQTNGQDLDTEAEAIDLTIGDTAAFSYVVTNTGDLDLGQVNVWDDELGAVCVVDAIAPGAVHVCQATKTVTLGLWSARGSVSGQPVDSAGHPFPDTTGLPGSVTGQDNSFHVGVGLPAIDIEKDVNGFDADTEDEAATLTIGDAITWSYVVTNTGALPLDMVTITDDELGPVCVLEGLLAPGEQHTCTMTGVTQQGLHGMTGSVSAIPAEGSNAVFDSDPSWYRASEATTTTQPTTTTTQPTTTSTTSLKVLGTTVVSASPQVLAHTGRATTGLGLAGGFLLAAGFGLIAAVRHRFGLD